MAIANIVCPNCEALGLANAHDSFQYPDDCPVGMVIRFEHGCPSYKVALDKDGKAIINADGRPQAEFNDDGETTPVPAYIGEFVVPGDAKPEA